MIRETKNARTRSGGWRDSPTAWCCELELALARGDYDRAAAAAHELRRLGWDVRYRPRVSDTRPAREEAAHGRAE